MELWKFKKRLNSSTKSRYQTGFQCDLTSPLPDLLSEERITSRNGLKTQNFVFSKNSKSELSVHFEKKLKKRFKKKQELKKS